jgi:prepilin-type N-terminal cleavage/methylation domain-containing protein
LVRFLLILIALSGYIFLNQGEKLMRRQGGFTLIELMMVAAIIVIIAAIAIPQLLRSRMNSNEGDAIGCLRTLSSAQTSFQASATNDIDGDGQGEYGTFAQLSSATPMFIDDSLGSGKKNGYWYQITTPGNVNDAEVMWEATAFPVSKGRTGNRTFYIDESGVLRGSDYGGPVGGAGVAATRLLAVPNAPPVGS